MGRVQKAKSVTNDILYRLIFGGLFGFMFGLYMIFAGFVLTLLPESFLDFLLVRGVGSEDGLVVLMVIGAGMFCGVAGVFELMTDIFRRNTRKE